MINVHQVDPVTEWETGSNCVQRVKILAYHLKLRVQMSMQMIFVTNTDIDTRHFWVEEEGNFLHEMVWIQSFSLSLSRQFFSLLDYIRCAH